ncbi:hypothetical protein AB434_3331 [Heyndrickxia coagulans]|uniref:Uncharacterized protein n=1 Tax=Heyndrickxia coagulans TaxID=1398 RepID=A0AAN0T5Y1_HEYCO|nr:hypothetical protein SB48_HM08orf03097 [Heyndrickxia coagulans]AKN55736.1 hypothetical protein AB434_3331 [Heyndrickxia coagulans]KYC64003.1 hypothetical protein B4100_3137 [Heyndrickxia coagulans]KYC87198.1 hypothetical protein B4096_3110 [Heyndrickxia coagulans]
MQGKIGGWFYFNMETGDLFTIFFIDSTGFTNSASPLLK